MDPAPYGTAPIGPALAGRERHPPAAATLLIGHPGWILWPGGVLGRLLATTDGTWYARWNGVDLSITALDDAAAQRPLPPVHHTRPAELPDGIPPDLTEALTALGTVVHLPTPDLWDAVTAQVLRSCDRSAQGSFAYRTWATSSGRRYRTPDGPIYAVPRPEQVRRLLPAGGRALPANRAHLGFLAEAADVYLRQHTKWDTTDAFRLFGALRRLRGLGSRSAACAAADYTGNYAVYRYDSPWLLSSAHHATPGRLPHQPQRFASLWQKWTPLPRQRHALTAFTLTHGNQAQDRAATTPGGVSGHDRPHPAHRPRQLA